MKILGEVYHAFEKDFPGKLSDAYLYGSYARGDYDRDSDIDILLSVNLPAENLPPCRRVLARINSDLSLKHDVTVSATVRAKSEFQKYSSILPYYKNILKEGIRYVE